MPDHGFNAYVHAPKDDLYQRTQWRDPYPAGEQADFNAEIRLARRLGIDWIPNISPALPEIPTLAVPTGVPSAPLCFSCPADLDAVAAKLEPFLAAGARTVMISFDDVVKALVYPQDLAAYGGGDRAYGEANGDFLTRLQSRLRDERARVRLLTVGADYSGVSRTNYLDGLRATLAPRIDVMWTGTNVPSEQWNPEDAGGYGQAIGRTPVVWENWTNDDTSGNVTPLGTARLFLGPYRRDPADARAVNGFFFNPANEAYLNLLPLATAGDWMSGPRGYRPRGSWLRAITGLAPGGTRPERRRRDSLRAWAETSWSNKLDHDTEAPTFVRLSSALVDRYDGPRWIGKLGPLQRELRLVELAPKRLRSLPRPEFAQQAVEFMDAAAQTAKAGFLASRLLAAERPALEVGRRTGGYAGATAAPDPEASLRLRAEMDDAERGAALDTEFTYGWRTPVAFEVPPYPVPANVMDAFVGRVRSIDSRWRATAAAEASSGVSLTLDGRPVAIDESGDFELGGGACGGLLVATDGAGNQTAVRLRDCNHRARAGLSSAAGERNGT